MFLELQLSPLIYVCFFHHYSKSTQARGKKGHDGQGNSEVDEVSASEQMPNEKQTEDQAQQHDAHSHEHSVSVSKILLNLNKAKFWK